MNLFIIGIILIVSIAGYRTLKSEMFHIKIKKL